jgi:hypothetical protein
MISRRPIDFNDVSLLRDEDGQLLGYSVLDEGRQIDYHADETFVRQAIANLHEDRTRFYRQLDFRRRVVSRFAALVQSGSA